MKAKAATPPVARQEKITLTRPDDWHLHLRDGEMLKTVLLHTARQFARAIVMPNLRPPIRTLREAELYRKRILTAIPEGISFGPLMTLYLTDETPVREIREAAAQSQGGDQLIYGVKMYPAGATTNSQDGVTDPRKCRRVFAEMEKWSIPLLVHGEVTDPHVDIFDREKVFIEQVLGPLCQQFPALRIVLEHVTTKEGVDFVLDHVQLGATITAHHLLQNRNAIFAGGLRPHNYCLPILKREKHQKALLHAVTSNRRFFLGTDSAPHNQHLKEAACGCAGCYTAYAAMELYAEAFDSVGALSNLEAFASQNGADWYGLPRNTEIITLERMLWYPPEAYPYEGGKVIPFGSPEHHHLQWKFVP